MPLNIPQTMQTLLTGDSAASRALSLAKNAVDPLLGFVNSSFTLLSDGSLKVVRNLVTSAFKADTTDAGVLNAQTLTVNGATILQSAATVSGGLNVLGTTTLKGTTVVQKKDDGTEGSFLVQNNATVQGALSTSTGVKSVIDMGWAWASAATVGTKYRTSVFTQNQEANNTFKFVTLFQPAYAGSIIALQTFSQGSAGGLVGVQLYKNQVTPGTPTIDVTPGSAAVNTGNTVSYSKGTQSFAALDYYIATVSFTVAGNQAINVRLYVELAA